MKYGMSVFSYWEMTLSEIKMYLEGYGERIREEEKVKASMDYTHAVMISDMIANILSSKSRIDTSIFKYYPSLFKEEKEEVEEKNRIRQLEVNKQRMIAYAEAMKRKRKR